MDNSHTQIIVLYNNVAWLLILKLCNYVTIRLPIATATEVG